MGPVDLIHRPELVRGDLPEGTFGLDVRKGGVDHFEFSIPEDARRFAIDRDVAWKLARNVVEVFGSPIAAQTVVMQFVGDSPPGFQLQAGSWFYFATSSGAC